MKNNTRKQLTNQELAAFCDQIAMVLNAGISPSEGVSIMLEDTQSQEGKEILRIISENCDEGISFHESIEETGVFPKYALDMIKIGEESGKLEEVMRSLAFHYNREENISRGIKSAVTYPLLIVGMMLIVILVLMIKVLPIFNDVFKQLGTEMTGISRTLMNVGSTISNYAIVFIAILVILVVAYIVFAKTDWGKIRFSKFLSKFFATRKLYEKIASGRLASGLALTLSAGIDTEKGIELVESLVENSELKPKLDKCKEMMEEGVTLTDALCDTEIFSNMYSRMITVGIKTGAVDKVFQKIANGYEEEVDEKISNLISVLEPTLVIVLSVIVCLILLSVMLPLMAVMSSIG